MIHMVRSAIHIHALFNCSRDGVGSSSEDQEFQCSFLCQTVAVLTEE